MHMQLEARQSMDRQTKEIKRGVNVKKSDAGLVARAQNGRHLIASRAGGMKTPDMSC
jgi:hypothetical protein